MRPARSAPRPLPSLALALGGVLWLWGGVTPAPLGAQSAEGRPDSEPSPIPAGQAAPPGAYAPGMDAQHYHFTISLVEGADWFAGRADIDLRLTDPLPEDLWLDLTGLRVDEVRIGGRRVDFELENGRVVFERPDGADVGDHLRVQIDYRGVPDDGLILGRTPHGAGSVFADNWPNRARFWIPTIDHPSDKATARFTVHAPEAWEVIAPGALMGEPTPTADDAPGGGRGRRSWVWEIGVPVSPYNLVIGATDFVIDELGRAACTRAPETPREDRCVQVTSWAFPQDADSARAKFRRAADMVEHFTWNIGLYPFEKLANVQSATRFGGMENATAIFYSATGVAGNSDDGVVAHEIAHQWFGDAITEARWSHLWLSEGFATYFGAQYYEEAVGPREFRRRMEANRREYLASDIVDQPVIRHETNLYDLLNDNNYEKGAWVLHMLRAELGERDFAETIRRYYTRHRYGTVLTGDFRAVAEEVSGRDLDWFFDQWLFRPGHPRLLVEHEWDEENHEIVLTVRQTQPEHWPTFRLHAVVELRHSSGSARRPVLVRKREEVVRLPFVTEPTAVVLDPDGWLLKSLEEGGNGR